MTAWAARLLDELEAIPEHVAEPPTVRLPREPMATIVRMRLR